MLLVCFHHRFYALEHGLMDAAILQWRRLTLWAVRYFGYLDPSATCAYVKLCRVDAFSRMAGFDCDDAFLAGLTPDRQAGNPRDAVEACGRHAR